MKANEDAIDRLGQEMEEAEEQTDDFAESLSDSGDMAEDSSGKFEKVGSVVAGVGTAIAAAAAAIGAAVVVASVELIKLGDEYNKAVNQISASTGATGTELEELGVIAQKVYTNNFGDSLEDVAEGLSVVQPDLWGMSYRKPQSPVLLCVIPSDMICRNRLVLPMH